jgi:hypothetical protein
MFDEIRLGIATPRDEPKSVDEMRQAIDRARQDSSLIHNAMDAARFKGMSGEDTYAMLAYYALRELERHYKANMQWLNLHPAPPIVVAADSDPNTGDQESEAR